MILTPRCTQVGVDSYDADHLRSPRVTLDELRGPEQDSSNRQLQQDSFTHGAQQDQSNSYTYNRTAPTWCTTGQPEPGFLPWLLRTCSDCGAQDIIHKYVRVPAKDQCRACWEYQQKMQQRQRQVRKENKRPIRLSSEPSVGPN